MPIAELRGIVLYIARGDSKKFLIKFIKKLVGKIATILRKQTENQYRFIKNKNLKFLVFYRKFQHNGTLKKTKLINNV